ncbi:ERF family protein [Streptomyces pseudovenezuelae]|uniref:ERF family protein n=1 Tax=Streptomyces pseudovenezuelae TaxID=67350 RepID=UPI002E81EAB5|nr:ERF family protein [Streptomyces pseudovenezuelae]WUA94411.1 ERF family protein [Streptomyces pseudovenezuelae]
MAQAVEAPATGTTAEGPTSHTQNQSAPSVYELMTLVMRDVRNVGKDGRNESQNYNFRGVDDAIGALAQPLRDHGVFMTPEVLDFKTEVRGRQNAVLMRIAFHFHGPAGDHVTAVTLGEGSDFADKAANKAMSAALKYALIHTFMIPVDAKSLDEGDRDHPVGQRSAADGYMERLRKPAVWNNPTALLAMHTEAKSEGLLGATVYAPGGEEMALGDLIVARGTTLKREAAEREQRQAAEAPAVAAQVAAETGGGAVRVGNVVIDRDCFKEHPEGQEFANQAALATSREAVENIRSMADGQGLVNSGVLAPDSGEPDMLSDYLERRAAELASGSESEFDGFMRRVRNGWNSVGPTRMALEEARQKGINDVVPFDGDHLHIQDVLEIRVKQLKERAASGGNTEGNAA